MEPRDVIDGKQRSELKEAMAELTKDKDRYEKAAMSLQARYLKNRDKGIEHFLPKLLTTVERYDHTFEDCVLREQGETMLGETFGSRSTTACLPAHPLLPLPHSLLTSLLPPPSFLQLRSRPSLTRTCPCHPTATCGTH